MISWNLKNRGLRPIGLDIGHDSVKMLQLAVNAERMSIFSADKVRIDPDISGDVQARRDFIASTIRHMLNDGGFRGKEVISCLPNETLKITSLRLPEAEDGKMEEALRKEAAERFGLNPASDAVDYMVAGSVNQGDEVRNEFILFAADNEAIKQHIEMLEHAGVKPVAIDIVPCALFRSFERLLRRQEDKERTVVFVDVGSRFTTVVFGRAGQISFVKQIPIGMEKFNQEIASKLGIGISEAGKLREVLKREKDNWAGNFQHAQRTAELDASTRQVIADVVSGIAEDLGRELSLCLRYYTVTFRGRRVERAFFTGGVAYDTVLLNVLKQQLHVEIEVAQPLKGFDMSGQDRNINLGGDRRGLLCEWAVAVGLGLKGWNNEPAVSEQQQDDYERN